MLSRWCRLGFGLACRQRQVYRLHHTPVPLGTHAADWRASSVCLRRKDTRSMSTELLSRVVDEERRRLLNRILYRSKQRGYLELDLLLGKWTTDHIDQLDDQHLGALVDILEEENPDLLSWFTGQAEPPEKIAKNPIFLAIHKQVHEKLAVHSSVETRAQCGQPWVRGWDDNRKAGGPQAGNQ